MLVVSPRRSGVPGRLRRWRDTVTARISTPSRLRWIVGAVMAFTLLGGDRGLVRLIGLLRDRSSLRSEIIRLTARRATLERAGDPELLQPVAGLQGRAGP